MNWHYALHVPGLPAATRRLGTFGEALKHAKSDLSWLAKDRAEGRAHLISAARKSLPKTEDDVHAAWIANMDGYRIVISRNV